MVTIVVHHKVRDYNGWLPHFEKHAEFRKSHGAKSAKVYRSVIDPNDVTVITEWPDRAAAESFASADDLRRVMQEAGVLGQPAIYILDGAGTYPV